MEPTLSPALLTRLRSAPAPRAFTLVEMLVVLAIITIVTTIALLGQSTFNQSLLLTDTAYNVALSVREMQSFGLSSRKTDTGVQNAGYGAHFSTGNLGLYTLFADTAKQGAIPANCSVGSDPTAPDYKPGNCLYDSSGDGVVDTFTFTRGYKISKFCGKASSGSQTCSDTGAINALDVTFLRSDTETVINTRNSSNVWSPMVSASVYITTPQGSDSRGVCFSAVGQISVVNGTCP